MLYLCHIKWCDSCGTGSNPVLDEEFVVSVPVRPCWQNVHVWGSHLFVTCGKVVEWHSRPLRYGSAIKMSINFIQSCFFHHLQIQKGWPVVGVSHQYGHCEFHIQLVVASSGAICETIFQQAADDPRLPLGTAHFPITTKPTITCLRLLGFPPPMKNSYFII